MTVEKVGSLHPANQEAGNTHKHYENRKRFDRNILESRVIRKPFWPVLSRRAAVGARTHRPTWSILG